MKYKKMSLYSKIFSSIIISSLTRLKPAGFNKLLSSINVDQTGNHEDNRQVVLKPAFEPDYHWPPYLTPTHQHLMMRRNLGKWRGFGDI